MSNRNERRYLAASAMNGILAHRGIDFTQTGLLDENEFAGTITFSLRYADALIEELGPSDEPAPGPAEYMADMSKDEVISLFDEAERRVLELIAKRQAEAAVSK